MRLFNINGKLANKNVNKYKINWNAKSRSKMQFAVKKFFYPYWKKNICYEEFPVFGTRMKVDIVNATKKIAIEVQGDQHDGFNKFFHNNSRLKYLQSIKRDYEKYAWLKMNSFEVLEIKKEDIENLSKEYIFHTFNILI